MRGITMQKLTTQVTLVPDGDPIFSERGWTISIEDEAGGEFVVVECHAEDYGKIAINPGDDWDSLRDAIDEMVKSCRA